MNSTGLEGHSRGGQVMKGLAVGCRMSIQL